MRVFIAGSPLESLTWRKEIAKVRIKFRDGTDEETKTAFLADLKRSVEKEIANGILPTKSN